MSPINDSVSMNDSRSVVMISQTQLSFVNSPAAQVLSQEGAISSARAECERLRLEAEALCGELGVTRGQDHELEEEFRALKSNFLRASEALEREISHSDELSNELLTLAHTQDTLLRERQRTHRNTLEVERVQALLSRVSQNRVRVSVCPHTHTRITHSESFYSYIHMHTHTHTHTLYAL